MAWPALIPLIMQGVGMAQQGAAGAQNKAILKQQGKVAANQATQDSYAIARQYRQLAGRQAAAMAQNGGAYEGSNLKLLHQSEALAFLDQLSIRYEGELRRKGLITEGNSVGRNSQMLAGTQLLSTLSSVFAQGKTMPTGY